MCSLQVNWWKIRANFRAFPPIQYPAFTSLLPNFVNLYEKCSPRRNLILKKERKNWSYRIEENKNEMKWRPLVHLHRFQSQTSKSRRRVQSVLGVKSTLSTYVMKSMKTFNLFQHFTRSLSHDMFRKAYFAWIIYLLSQLALC